MKLIKMLLLPVLFVAMWSLTGCNEEPTTSVTPDTTPSLSKLTIPAGATITNATFFIYVEDEHNRSIDVHKVNVPWDEATETWNIFDAKGPSQFDPVALGSFTALHGYQDVDITTLVQAWVEGTTPNNGVLLNQTVVEPGFIAFWSRERLGGAVAPYIQVTYTPAGGGDPVIVTENAFADTWISNQFPNSFDGGSSTVLYLGKPFVDYNKYVLVQFDIEQPDPCFQDETAWAANGNAFGSLRYTTRGNWATYLKYENVAKTVNIYAGQNIFVGTATLTPSNGSVIINISLESGWALNPDAPEDNAVKIQGYTSAPSGNPAPGLFTTYKGNDLTNITVEKFAFYGIHLDVRGECP